VGVIVVTGSGRSLLRRRRRRGAGGPRAQGRLRPGHAGVAGAARLRYGAAEFDASFAYHFGLGKPVIAAINGPAAGVGLALACFADLRFAAAGAKLTTAHGKLNLPAEYGLSWLLPRMIGLTRANELLLSSRVFLAEEASAGARQSAFSLRDSLLCRNPGLRANLMPAVCSGLAAADALAGLSRPASRRGLGGGRLRSAARSG
jgi:1,4-dihydroxy-2-naphthoyl-CoA synthase